MTEFGTWIRQHRLARGLKQTECAALCGMKIQQWNRLETQVVRPEYDTVRAVAEVLGRPVEEALTIAGYPVHKPEPTESRLARRLAPYLARIPDHKREKALDRLVRTAQDLADFSTT